MLAAARVGSHQAVYRFLQGKISIISVYSAVTAADTCVQQVAVFFRSRAEIEEKYARSVIELYRMSGDVYGRSDCKAGSVRAVRERLVHWLTEC